MPTLAEQIREIAQSYRELLPGDAVHDAALDGIADRLDALSARFLTADPDENERLALSLGNPEHGFEDHGLDLCTSARCTRPEECPFMTDDEKSEMLPSYADEQAANFLTDEGAGARA